jgi:hypothetical protein
MPRTASDEENKRIIMDLDVLVKSYNFPHIVRCLGYFIRQVIKKQKESLLYFVFFLFGLFRQMFGYVWN